MAAQHSEAGLELLAQAAASGPGAAVQLAPGLELAGKTFESALTSGRMTAAVHFPLDGQINYHNPKAKEGQSKLPSNNFTHNFVQKTSPCCACIWRFMLTLAQAAGFKRLGGAGQGAAVQIILMVLLNAAGLLPAFQRWLWHVGNNPDDCLYPEIPHLPAGSTTRAWRWQWAFMNDELPATPPGEPLTDAELQALGQRLFGTVGAGQGQPAAGDQAAAQN